LYYIFFQQVENVVVILLNRRMTTAFRDKESIYCVERRLRGTFAQFKLAAISCGGSIQCPACQCENDTHSL